MKSLKNAAIHNTVKIKNNNLNNNCLVVDNLNIKSLLCARQTEFIIEGRNHKNAEEIKKKLKCIFVSLFIKYTILFNIYSKII